MAVIETYNTPVIVEVEEQRITVGVTPMGVFYADEGLTGGGPMNHDVHVSLDDWVLEDLALADGSIQSITGTPNEIDVDNTVPSAPVLSLHPAVRDALALANNSLQPLDIGVLVQAYSAQLDAYAAGPMPSPFSLSIFDSADAAAWRAAIGAGTSSTTPAPPTALIGLTAIDGVATTFMRSDAAPALDQNISPVWTGNHSFSGTSTFTGPVDFNGVTPLQYMLKDENGSPSVISGGLITAAGGGAINISAGTGFLRIANDPNAVLANISWSAVSGLALVDNVINYVYVEYNGGAPAILLQPTLLNRYDAVILGIVQREGTMVHISKGTVPAGNVSRLANRYLYATYGAQRANGLITGESGTRNLSNTAGLVFTGLNEYQIVGKNTASGDTFSTYHRNGSGGWTLTTGQTQYNNTQYDDGTGTLNTMASGRHGVHWVFRTLTGEFALLYGQSDYTLAQAQAAGLPPTRPNVLQNWHGVFCAKIIFQRDQAVAKQIDIAFTTFIGASAASDHGTLAGLMDDDHPQYLTEARGDLRYTPIGVSSGYPPQLGYAGVN